MLHHVDAQQRVRESVERRAYCHPQDQKPGEIAGETPIREQRPARPPDSEPAAHIDRRKGDDGCGKEPRRGPRREDEVAGGHRLWLRGGSISLTLAVRAMVELRVRWYGRAFWTHLRLGSDLRRAGC